MAMQNIITNICLKRQFIIFDSIDDLQYLHIVCSLIIEYDCILHQNLVDILIYSLNTRWM